LLAERNVRIDIFILAIFVLLRKRVERDEPSLSGRCGISVFRVVNRLFGLEYLVNPLDIGPVLAGLGRIVRGGRSALDRNGLNVSLCSITLEAALTLSLSASRASIHCPYWVLQIWAHGSTKFAVDEQLEESSSLSSLCALIEATGSAMILNKAL